MSGSSASAQQGAVKTAMAEVKTERKKVQMSGARKKALDAVAATAEKRKMVHK